jgi:hypothetical protein
MPANWNTVAKRSRMLRNGTVGARSVVATAGLSGPRLFRPDTPKAELRKQAAEAMASYAGPITRCGSKQQQAMRDIDETPNARRSAQ